MARDIIGIKLVSCPFAPYTPASLCPHTCRVRSVPFRSASRSRSLPPHRLPWKKSETGRVERRRRREIYAPTDAPGMFFLVDGAPLVSASPRVRRVDDPHARASSRPFFRFASFYPTPALCSEKNFSRHCSIARQLLSRALSCGQTAFSTL